MRKDGDVLVLSRRNLETLIAKLDANVEEPDVSAVTLIAGGEGWLVRAEENDVHYSDRPAGRIHPRDEAKISAPKTGLV